MNNWTMPSNCTTVLLFCCLRGITTKRTKAMAHSTYCCHTQISQRIQVLSFFIIPVFSVLVLILPTICSVVLVTSNNCNNNGSRTKKKELWRRRRQQLTHDNNNKQHHKLIIMFNVNAYKMDLQQHFLYMLHELASNSKFQCDVLHFFCSYCCCCFGVLPKTLSSDENLLKVIFFCTNF